jgi:hypothetical protein
VNYGQLDKSSPNLINSNYVYPKIHKIAKKGKSGKAHPFFIHAKAKYAFDSLF